MQKGFIKLHRKFQDWEWYNDVNARLVFIHLMLIANHTDKKWRGISIKRGQVLIGRDELAKQVGITEQSVRTALKNLQSTSELTITKTQYCSLISITNYENYQGANQQSTSELTSNQPEPNQSLTSNQPVLKNENNEKNEKNEKKKSENQAEFEKEKINDFYEKFRSKYPQWITPMPTPAFKSALLIDEFENIMKGLEHYCEDIIKNKKQNYIKNADNWLNERLWQKDYGNTVFGKIKISAAEQQDSRYKKIKYDRDVQKLEIMPYDVVFAKNYENQYPEKVKELNKKWGIYV